jgi:ubiquinone biosynthesis protein COQ9
MASTSRLLRSKALRRVLIRDYHSYTHPPPPGPFNPTETAILSAALPHVPSHGFTNTALSLGAKDAGYIDASVNLFPKGAFHLVHYHLVNQRLGLADNLHIIQPRENEKAMGVGAKVKALTWARLKNNEQMIHRWQEVRHNFGHNWASFSCLPPETTGTGTYGPSNQFTSLPS